MSDKKKEWDKVGQAAKRIFNISSVPHKRPKKPTKQDRKGNPKTGIVSMGETY